MEEFQYIPVLVPSKGVGMEWIDRAAVGVRARRIDHTIQDAGVLGVQGHGMLDSGAAVPVVAMWLLDNLDIPVDEE